MLESSPGLFGRFKGRPGLKPTVVDFDRPDMKTSSAMTTNNLKLVIVAVITVVLIGAIIYDSEANAPWAVPLLTLLVGFVIGNAEVTSREGNTSPIVSLDQPE